MYAPGMAMSWMMRFWIVLPCSVFSVPMARVTSACGTLVVVVGVWMVRDDAIQSNPFNQSINQSIN